MSPGRRSPVEADLRAGCPGSAQSPSTGISGLAVTALPVITALRPRRPNQLRLARRWPRCRPTFPATSGISRMPGALLQLAPGCWRAPGSASSAGRRPRSCFAVAAQLCRWMPETGLPLALAVRQRAARARSTSPMAVASSRCPRAGCRHADPARGHRSALAGPWETRELLGVGPQPGPGHSCVRAGCATASAQSCRPGTASIRCWRWRQCAPATP